jgi:macrodomain Ter protein organizer (MatP/YcbG family)
MELLKQNQISYLFDELHHPKMGKLFISNHVKDELRIKFGKSVRDVISYFENFKHQSGTKRCPHLRVIDQKISAWTHPNSDYLYCKALNMAIVVDKYNKVMITVLHLNTDYYRGY